MATKALHFIVSFSNLCAKVEISPDKMELAVNPFTGKKNKKVSREPVGGVKPSEPRPKPKSDKGATDSDNFL